MRALRRAVVLDPELAELFMSEPNPALEGGRPELIVTGATLGGSSAINGAVFSTPALKVRPTLSCSTVSCSIITAHVQVPLELA